MYCLFFDDCFPQYNMFFSLFSQWQRYLHKVHRVCRGSTKLLLPRSEFLLRHESADQWHYEDWHWEGVRGGCYFNVFVLLSIFYYHLLTSFFHEIIEFHLIFDLNIINLSCFRPKESKTKSNKKPSDTHINKDATHSTPYHHNNNSNNSNNKHAVLENKHVSAHNAGETSFCFVKHTLYVLCVPWRKCEWFICVFCC